MDDVDLLKIQPEVLRVYNHYLKLQKQNGRYVGLCPFHQENTPSLTVFPKDMLFKCFGCGQAGSIYAVVQKMENCDFKTAVAKVREFVGENNWAKDAERVDATFRPAVESQKTFKTYTLAEYASFEKALSQNQDALGWLLRERGITAETAKKLHLGYRRDVGRLAGEKNADIADKGWVAFPCIEDGKVLSLKYRSVARKSFCKQPGMASALFNTESIDLFAPVMLVEGECLSGDTQVLTPSGWVRLDQYSGQSVAQWFMGGCADFIKPMAYVFKEYTGDMFCFKSKTNLVNQVVTPEHRVLYCPERKDRAIDPIVRLAKDTPSKRIRFFRTCNLDAPGIPLTEPEIRLQVMIQADASVESRAEDKNLEGRHWQALNLDGWRIEVSKTRKRERIKKLLSEAKLSFSEYETGRGNLIVRFYTPPGMFHKVFPSSMYQMSPEQREVFLDELQYWDSHTAKSGTRMYVSVVKENADLVQAVFACTGLSAKFGVESRGGTRQDKYWVSVSLRDKRGRHDLTSGTTIEKTKLPHSGKVYCLTVPSSFLLIRRENVISVTGNCDAAVLVQAGFNAVSLQSASTYPTPQQKDQLMRAESVILAGDNDGAVGSSVMEKLWRELAERTYLLRWPVGTKDANQFFLETCKRDPGVFKTKVSALIQQAKTQPAPDVYSIQEVLRSGKQTHLVDHPQRFHFPWPSVDKMAIIIPGHVVCVMATSTGMGKSAWTIEATLHECRKYRKTVINYQCEMSAEEIAVMVAANVLKKDRNHLSAEEMKEAADQLEGVQYYVGYNPNLSRVGEVLDLIEAAIRRLGCGVCVLDHLHHVCRNEENEVKAQADAMQRIKRLAVQYQCVFFVVGQPRKANQQSKGKLVHLSDGKGSETFSSDANAFFALHRDLAKNSDPDIPQKDTYEPTTHVHLLKARTKGEGNAVAKLLFIGELATFSEIDYAHEDPYGTA